MEGRQESIETRLGYCPYQMNVFGRRARLPQIGPRDGGREPQPEVRPAWPVNGMAGQPYFPVNGRRRYVNFLGRTSWERRDRLLVNRP